MSVSDHITVPFSDAEVDALNAWQHSGQGHPFTCPADGTHDSMKHSDSRILVAHPDGWWCPFDRCGYHQTWAHSFMVGQSATGQTREDDRQEDAL